MILKIFYKKFSVYMIIPFGTLVPFSNETYLFTILLHHLLHYLNYHDLLLLERFLFPPAQQHSPTHSFRPAQQELE